MTLVLTEKAAKEIQRVKDEQKYDDSMFLRVGVRAAGCSGLEYSIAFDKEFDVQADEQLDCHGVKVIVNKGELQNYLTGTTVDWFDGFDRKGFVFDNPNAKRSCGCGNSFQV